MKERKLTRDEEDMISSAFRRSCRVVGVALPMEPTDAMCHAGVEAIKKAMAGKGAPFQFPDIEHLYDIWAAMVRAYKPKK